MSESKSMEKKTESIFEKIKDIVDLVARNKNKIENLRTRFIPLDDAPQTERTEPAYLSNYLIDIKEGLLDIERHIDVTLDEIGG